MKSIWFLHENLISLLRPEYPTCVSSDMRTSPCICIDHISPLITIIISASALCNGHNAAAPWRGVAPTFASRQREHSRLLSLFLILPIAQWQPSKFYTRESTHCRFTVLKRRGVTHYRRRTLEEDAFMHVLPTAPNDRMRWSEKWKEGTFPLAKFLVEYSESISQPIKPTLGDLWFATEFGTVRNSGILLIILRASRIFRSEDQNSINNFIYRVFRCVYVDSCSLYSARRTKLQTDSCLVLRRE